MAVGGVILEGETRHDDVGPKFTDHPNRVGENLLTIPDAQGFTDRLRESEVVRPGEELLAVIDPPRGQKFLRADDAELLAQLRSDQVLAAIAARHREIRRIVKRAVRPIRDQPGILVIGMRRDVEHAAEHIQLFEREPNLRRVHRIRRFGRANSSGQTQAEVHQQRGQSAARERQHDRGRAAANGRRRRNS